MSGATPPPIQGLCPPQFQAVRDQFERHLADGEDLGAGFAIAINGRLVIDLTGGWADRRQARAFGPETLVSIFSTTKAVSALMMARLVGQGRLDYRQTVASIWPAFAAAGKQAQSPEPGRQLLAFLRGEAALAIMQETGLVAGP